MGLLYILVGFLLGSQTMHLVQKKESLQKKEDDQTTSRQNPDAYKVKKSIQVRKKFKKQFNLMNTSPTKIDPKKISVNIKTEKREKNKSSPGPNFIALTILWAHYVAGQLGLLIPDQPPPWDLSLENNINEKKARSVYINLESGAWRNFLSKMIKDKSWIKWIKNSKEIKARTLTALANQ